MKLCGPRCFLPCNWYITTPHHVLVDNSIKCKCWKYFKVVCIYNWRRCTWRLTFTPRLKLRQKIWKIGSSVARKLFLFRTNVCDKIFFENTHSYYRIYWIYFMFMFWWCSWYILSWSLPQRNWSHIAITINGCMATVIWKQLSNCEYLSEFSLYMCVQLRASFKYKKLWELHYLIFFIQTPYW